MKITSYCIPNGIKSGDINSRKIFFFSRTFLLAKDTSLFDLSLSASKRTEVLPILRSVFKSFLIPFLKTL